MGKQFLKDKIKMRKWITFEQEKNEPLEKEGYYALLFGWCSNEGCFSDAIHSSELKDYPNPIILICSEPFNDYHSAEKWAKENEFDY